VADNNDQVKRLYRTQQKRQKTAEKGSEGGSTKKEKKRKALISLFYRQNYWQLSAVFAAPYKQLLRQPDVAVKAKQQALR
jgi:hypothetical protein